jgi:thiamine biosynthesis lipoprotein
MNAFVKCGQRAVRTDRVPVGLGYDTWFALGTTVVLAVTERDALEPARAEVRRVLDEVDLACSRFREDSEIVALTGAGGEPVKVSPPLFAAVGAAVRAAQLTDGDVDPTLGSALRALGYDRDFDEIRRGPPARVRVTTVPGWQALTLDERAQTIRVPPGVELDLGATAKALAADWAAEAAQTITRAGVLVSLGGDMAVAGEPPPDGWRVRVTDDHRASVAAPGQWISLRTGGLATSSTAVRRWLTDQGPAHHLLDPATGRPVESVWRTASVCAGSCLDANTASTAAIVRGKRAPAWLEEIGLPSRLVSVAGTVIHLAGWPAEWEELPVGETIP